MDYAIGQQVTVTDGGWTGTIARIDAEQRAAYIRFPGRPDTLPYAFEAIRPAASMDLRKFTTAQLYIMHRAANGDARAAYALAEHKSIELLELAVMADNDTYAAVNAEFAVLMAQADDHRAYSRQIYDEIARRASAPQAGGTTGNGTRYCRTCGFTDCPSITEGGDCPRWPARDEYTSLHGQAGDNA